MKNTLNTIENETSKWFRRFTGVVMAMIVSALFLMGFIFIAGLFNDAVIGLPIG